MILNMNYVHEQFVVIARLCKKGELKKYERWEARALMILLPIKGFSVLTHSPFHIKLPFASSLVVAAITAGTVHLPGHRWAY